MSERVYYFSNGTEGSIWQAEWCNRCTHDHATHNTDPDYDNGCQHIVSMICGMHDDAFIRVDNDRGYDELRCLNFARCPCDNGPDDPGIEPPPPVDPNQCVLFDVEQVTPGVWRSVVLDELTPDEVPA